MNTKIEIDISTNEKKEKVLELFKTFKYKADIYKFFNVKDTPYNIKYVNDIAQKIGFDFSYYKENKKKYCLVCGKELKKQQKKFCSSSCAAKYNNKGRKVSEKTREKISKSLTKNNENIKKETYCLVCGKKLKHGQKLFCSNKCFQDFKNEERLKKWKSNPDLFSS